MVNMHTTEASSRTRDWLGVSPRAMRLTGSVIVSAVATLMAVPLNADDIKCRKPSFGQRARTAVRSAREDFGRARLAREIEKRLVFQAEDPRANAVLQRYPMDRRVDVRQVANGKIFAVVSYGWPDLDKDIRLIRKLVVVRDRAGAVSDIVETRASYIVRQGARLPSVDAWYSRVVLASAVRRRHSQLRSEFAATRPAWSYEVHEMDRAFGLVGMSTDDWLIIEDGKGFAALVVVEKDEFLDIARARLAVEEYELKDGEWVFRKIVKSRDVTADYAHTSTARRPARVADNGHACQARQEMQLQPSPNGVAQAEATIFPDGVAGPYGSLRHLTAICCRRAGLGLLCATRPRPEKECHHES